MGLGGSWEVLGGSWWIFFFFKKPKACFIWGPEVGTFPGHKPIIIPSCGAVLFFPGCASMRSIPHEPLEGRRMDLEGSYGRNTGQHKIAFIDDFLFKNFSSYFDPGSP